MDDQCPVCKSDRYLNPKLRLLVSSCYHKMYASLHKKEQLIGVLKNFLKGVNHV